MKINKDKFIETHHGGHTAHVVRRDDRGEDEMSTFVLDAPNEDISLLMLGLATIVDDPEKLQIIKGEIDEECKEKALDLALSLYELLNRRYRRQHDCAWHCLIGIGEINNSTTDTAAGLMLNIYGSECTHSSVEGDDDAPGEPHAPKPFLPEGTVVIDT